MGTRHGKAVSGDAFLMSGKALFQEAGLRYSTCFRLPNCCLSAKVDQFMHINLATDNKQESNDRFI